MIIKNTTTFFLQKVYNKTNNGEYQIRMRVRWNGNKYQTNVGYTIDAEKWADGRCKRNTSNAKGYSAADINRRLTMLECMCWTYSRLSRWADKNGYLTDLSYQDFAPRLKTVRDKEVIYLNWDELMAVYSFTFPEGKKYLEKVRDVFCFQCFTSLRYSDVAKLKRSDIVNGVVVGRT